jgi:ubiquitin-protein ligase
VTPRERRLRADLAHMEELAERDEVVFRGEGSPPETYHVMLNGPGLARDADGNLRVRELHRCTIYLSLEYPRRPPQVAWLTPVFHPNMLPPERNGGVCIGGWSPSESLADLCIRLKEMVAYRSVNIADYLDADAARWARENGVAQGVDLNELVARFAGGGGTLKEAHAG